MHIYDTKLEKKVALTPADGETIKLYTCGPTIYNFAHIGNLRTYVFEDLLRRTILLSGMKIFHVMNLTDVDDKTIKASKEASLPLKTFTTQFKEAFFQDLRSLRIQPAEVYPAATDHIDEMIRIINSLIKQGYAYVKGEGNVFFRIAKFDEYGALSHLKLEGLQAGASERIDSDEYDKENLSDFVLWKAYDKERDGDVYWEAPWGRGRPGWHIECSAMAMHYLGETLDLHVGGVDNIFPHHENEIAQSEACTGKCFSRHWMHSSHLVVDGKKMSKSAGNFYTLRDLLKKGYHGREVRYLLLTAHYRTQLNFTFEGLDGARHALRRIDDFIDRLHQLHTVLSTGMMIKPIIEKWQTQFTQHLFDDLNIAPATAALFELIREINILIDKEQLGKNEAHEILEALKQFDLILGVMERDEVMIPDDVQKLFEERMAARKSKDWKRSDQLRDEIFARGFIVEDSRSGAFIKPRLD